jgi:hypothetical protein
MIPCLQQCGQLHFSITVPAGRALFRHPPANKHRECGAAGAVEWCEGSEPDLSAVGNQLFNVPHVRTCCTASDWLPAMWQPFASLAGALPAIRANPANTARIYDRNKEVKHRAL